MSKKKILILTSIMLIILISVASIYFKMKYDEKENKNQYTIKNNKRALHFISSITLKNRTRLNLCISQNWKQVLWEVL